jgi:hypothetical protein
MLTYCWQHSATYLTNVRPLTKHTSVEFLYIVVLHFEVQPLGIDQAMKHGVEHEGIVGARRD